MAVVRNEAPPHIVPIASLNAYQARWTIRARVTAKSDIRVFSNARGDGAESRAVSQRLNAGGLGVYVPSLKPWSP